MFRSFEIKQFFVYILIVFIGFQMKAYDSNVAVADFQSAKQTQNDTVLNLPLFTNNISEIRELIDTTLSINPYSYLVFTRYNHPRQSGYFVMESGRVTKDNITNVCGVYSDCSARKTLYLVNLSDEELSEYGFVKTDSMVRVKCMAAQPNMVGTVSLGVKAYVKRNPNRTFTINLSYNNEDIKFAPVIASHYAFLNPKWDIDSLKHTETYKQWLQRKRTNQTVRADRYRQPMNSVSINQAGDTLRTNLNYYIKTETIDRFLTVPVYRFSNNNSGELTDRICSTVAANDIYHQLIIRPNPDYRSEKGIIITEDAKRWHELPDLLKGIVFVGNNNFPVFLFNLTPEYLEEYGLVKTGRSIAIHLVADWVGLLPDAMTGYYVTMRKDNNDNFNIQLYFNNRPVLEDEARPFQWIVDEYIN